MPDTLAGQTTKLAAWRAAYPFVALHGPGAPGVDTELAGGMPAYARQSSALAPAPAGGLTATDVLTFAVPAGSTVAVVAYWSAATGGVASAGRVAYALRTRKRGRLAPDVSDALDAATLDVVVVARRRAPVRLAAAPATLTLETTATFPRPPFGLSEWTEEDEILGLVLAGVL